MIRHDTPTTDIPSDYDTFVQPHPRQEATPGFRRSWSPESDALLPEDYTNSYTRHANPLHPISTHRELPTLPSTFGLQTSTSSGYNIGMLLQRIRELEMRNTTLTQQMYELRGELTGARAAYDLLLARLPTDDVLVASSSDVGSARVAPPSTPIEAALLAVRNHPPIITLNRTDYRLVRFWHRSDFTNWVSEKTKASTLEAQEGSLQYKFLESEDGECIREQKKKLMLETLYAAWHSLLHAGLLPDTWGRASIEVRMYVWATMEAAFVELRFCDGHWKTQLLATLNYPWWSSKHLRRITIGGAEEGDGGGDDKKMAGGGRRSLKVARKRAAPDTAEVAEESAKKPKKPLLEGGPWPVPSIVFSDMLPPPAIVGAVQRAGFSHSVAPPFHADFLTSYSGSYSTPLLIVDGEDEEVDFPARLLDKRSGLFENSQPTSLSVGLIVAGTIIFAVSLAALAYYIARRRQRALASDDSMASFIQMEEGGSGGSRSPPYIQPRPPSPYPHHLLPRPPSPYPHHLHSKPLPSLAHLLPPPPQQQQQQPAHSTARQSKAARATQQLYTLPTGVTLSHRVPDANGERTLECDFLTNQHDLKKVLLPQLQELAKLLDVVPQIARPRKDHYLKSLQEFSAEMMGGQAVWKAKYRPNNTRSHKGPVDSTATTTASGRPRKVNDSYSRREKMKVAGVIGLRPETRTKPDMKIMEYMVKEGCSLAASDPLYTGQTALVVQGPDNEWKVIPKARTSQASSAVASVGTYRPPPPPPSRTSESSAASVDTFRHPPPPSSRTSASSAASVETFRPPPPPPSRISSELSTTDEYSTGPLMPELEIILAQMVPFGITGQYWHTIRRQMQLATNPRASYNSATPSFLAEVTPAFPAVPQQVAIHDGWPFERRGVDRSATSEHQQPPISARSVSSSSSSASLWSPPTPPPIPSEHSSRMDIDGDCAPVAMQVDGIVNRPSASMQVDVADRPSAPMQGDVMDPPSSKRTKARRKADPSRKYMMPGPANSIIPCTRKHLPAHTMPQIPYSQDFQRLNEIFGPWDYFVPYDLEVIPLQIDGQRIPLVEWTPLLKAIAPELYTQVKVRLSNVIVFIREYRKFANHEDFLKHYPNGFTATVATVRARRQAEAEAFVPRIALRYPDTFGLKKPIAIVSRYEELAIGSPSLVDADLAEEIHEYYRVPPTFTPRTSTDA